MAEIAGHTSVPSVGPAPVAADVRTLITGVSHDSHRVRPGDLFAALPGATTHGAAWAADAVAAGAVAVLTDQAGADRIGTATGAVSGVPTIVVPDPREVLGRVSAAIYGHPAEKLAVFGVTGTSGKTTTSYLIEAALAANGLTTGMIGTVETRIAGQVLPSDFTTPEAPDLQALLAVMVERGVAAVAMEVSSHALALGRVAATGFAVGAFTNLSQDHLDFHPDMEHYFRAKALLFDGRARAGVIDVDDPFGARLAAENPTAATVSTDPARQDTTWGLIEVGRGSLGSQLITARGPDGLRLTFELALPGSFNVANALLALASVHAGGLDVRAGAAALSSVVVPGRMQPVDLGQDFLAVVDYAHKPAALTAVLAAVRGSVPGRVIVVVGAGGDRDRAKRPMMGEQAALAAEIVVVTDDNPRSEDPAAIRAEVLLGARTVDGTRILEIGDRAEAITAAVREARPGDAVVVAGKGHELGQYQAGQIRHFSDVEELSRAVRERLEEATP
ncbi:UDP-N-acetylmuramoyl-L-alanyl-D-glutamate--2,6-diaminopimelate ligase [Nakamurella silvestris]|nr:UDP-N-acetylmuramoyl-L-alanyl-D-glutamate--2,6-diaminopimelate ligase [Nakamurella silvestris]